MTKLIKESTVTLSELQEQMKTWQAHNFPNRTAHMPLLGVSEEAGELVASFGIFESIGRLSHAHLKTEQGIRGTAQKHFEAKKDAVADILIFLADYCNAAGIDMQLALDETWQSVSCRDWQKFPKNGKTE